MSFASGAGDNPLPNCLTSEYKSNILFIELVSGLDEEEVIPSCPPAGSIFGLRLYARFEIPFLISSKYSRCKVENARIYFIQ